VVVLAALLAPGALAQKGPQKEPLPFEPMEFAAGEVCPFAVKIESVANKEMTKTLPNGRQVINGRLTLRVTNLDANRSMVVNASGPGTITELENDRIRMVFRGRNLLWSFERDVTGAGLFLTTGRVVGVLDLGTDTVVSHQHKGRATDLCARLAA
jgi:hypothetical protein